MEVHKVKITKNKIIKILSVLLIMVGIGIMLQYPIRDFLIQRNTDTLLAITEEQMRENRENEGVIDFADVREVTTDAVLRASMYADASYMVIGRIQIEAVGLDLPILNTLTDEAMFLGASIMSHEQVMGQGNYTLTSHHMRNPDLLFSPLDRVNIGDEVVISDDTGYFTYVVTSTEVVPPTAMEVLDEIEGKAIITLITCADGGANRLVVRGELVK